MPQPRTALSPPTPSLNRLEFDRLLHELAGPGLCGEVQGQLRGGNQVTLTGFAGGRRDLDPIERALKDKGATVTRQVALRPWPQCEVLVNLREPLGQARGLKVNVASATAAELARGETIRIEITTPNTPSYVYLTYVQADGHAMHLTRPAGRRAAPTPANTRLVFGDGQAGRDHYRSARPMDPRSW